MKQVAKGVHQLTIQRFVNLYFVETNRSGEWVLVDTGLPGSEKAIIAAADELFYPGTHPEAILLTHGHMDHSGSVRALAEHWKVPVLAHPLEMPFLTAKAVYPPADPTVDRGGSLAFVARFFPPQSFQYSDLIQTLPTDSDQVPYLPGWRWLHTPGHAPGQLALFREEDRTLLGGDAFATANHESVPALLLQIPEINVAGAPFNYDWEQVRASVQKLAALRPDAIGCGHGPAVQGAKYTEQLQQLADNFPMPRYGRYVAQPARLDGTGVVSVPAASRDALPGKLAIAAAGVAALVGVALLIKKQKAHRQNDYPRKAPETPRNPRTGKAPE
jgi:glyoxylase-like metal-dependent hydrolase (beta-lactamase superfamily II)